MNHVETSYRVIHYAATSPRAQSLRLARWARNMVRRNSTEDLVEPTANVADGSSENAPADG
jgi:hypothetical protein